MASPDTVIPSEYRRILRLVERDTHCDVVRGRLRQFSDSLLFDWLAELEEIGYVGSRVADYTQDLDFAILLESKPEGPTAPEDLWRIETQAQAAGTALERSGAYLSPDRLNNREPLGKNPGETTILIVEDDPDQLALADLRVSMAGYRVRTAQDRREMIEDLRAQALPDLVLLDVMLPDGNGFDILAAMRCSGKLAMLPVVMLTALEGQDDIRRGLELGADGYITKPYSKKILENTIRAVLKHA
ncbi:MAG TPA: response regulator [Burkholderiales bacterium]|nr:response regulator [Burkholderiales bacterium]